MPYRPGPSGARMMQVETSMRPYLVTAFTCDGLAAHDPVTVASNVGHAAIATFTTSLAAELNGPGMIVSLYCIGSRGPLIGVIIFFFLNDPPPPEFSPLPLHDPFPISFQLSPFVFGRPRGGPSPAYATDVMVHRVYGTAFGAQAFAMASALAVVFAIALLLLKWPQ